jgi:hypothetical protein
MTPAQAIAQGLEFDSRSWDLGRADAIAGRPWRLEAPDLLAYASGFVAGTLERRAPDPGPPS